MESRARRLRGPLYTSPLQSSHRQGSIKSNATYARTAANSQSCGTRLSTTAPRPPNISPGSSEVLSIMYRYSLKTALSQASDPLGASWAPADPSEGLGGPQGPGSVTARTIRSERRRSSVVRASWRRRGALSSIEQGAICKRGSKCGFSKMHVLFFNSLLKPISTASERLKRFITFLVLCGDNAARFSIHFLYPQQTFLLHTTFLFVPCATG